MVNSSLNSLKISPDQVSALPGLGPVATTQFAGYAPVTGEYYPKTPSGKPESLFYWFVGTPDYANSPTIIWTNGGPGSSSFWGFFLENGPYAIESASEPKLSVREHGWNTQANYLMFEHPLSVMLSFANDDKDIPANVEEGMKQYFQALLNFLSLHPEIANNPIILAGESYAGTYLPLLAKLILEHPRTSPGIDLKAMILMDAWVDPYVQMLQDTEYAYKHGMISLREKQRLDDKYQYNLPDINQAIQNVCGLYMTNIAQRADPPFQPIIDYLNRHDVRESIHVGSDTPLTVSWSAQVSNNYQFAVNDSYRDIVNALLEHGLHTLVVSGLNDAKDCNFLGTGQWLDKLTGNVAEQFHQAPTTQWRMQSDSEVLGFLQNGGQLCWVKVLNAGHMAARDQPALITLFRQLIGF